MGAYPDSGAKEFTLFSGNSPTSGAGTFIGTSGNGAIIGMGQTPVAVVDLQLIAPAGGTLDVYLQSSVDAQQDGVTGTWYDVAHVPQLAAGSGPFRFVLTLSRGFNKIAAVPNAVNAVSNTPTLGANLMIPDALGIALRVILVPGAGAAAAAQSIKMLVSK